MIIGDEATKVAAQAAFTISRAESCSATRTLHRREEARARSGSMSLARAFGPSNRDGFAALGVK